MIPPSGVTGPNILDLSPAINTTRPGTGLQRCNPPFFIEDNGYDAA